MVAAISSLSTLAMNKYGELIECSLGLHIQLHQQYVEITGFSAIIFARRSGAAGKAP
jgi:hypothetical protein